MKIFFITTHFNTGGITSYILTLAEGLLARGHEVWVASSGGNDVLRLEALGGHHVQVNIRTKSEVHPKLWMSFGPLKSLIQKESIDIIHAHTRVTQVLGFFLSRATGINMVTTCHGFFRPRWFRKTFPCWGEAVIAISKPVSLHLSKDFGVPSERIFLIANGINLKRFAMATAEKRAQARGQWGVGEGPLIGIIARLSSVKGIDVLIKSMPLILKEMPSAHLLIAGQGPEEMALKALTRELQLIPHVHFKSITNQSEHLLCAFDVFVMPSLMEGLGLSVIEAQACGIPVVASQVGGLIDLIEEGKTGYLVPAGDPVALARRIVDILRDPPRAQRMAQEARLRVEEHFSAERMTQETLGVYQQCLPSKG